MIEDYETPAQKDLPRDLDATLKPYITFLKQCRPLSVSMGNAVRFIKTKLNELGSRSEPLKDSDAKEELVNAIDSFIYENIDLAARQIAITGNKKIRDGDVILTYGW